MNRTEKGQQENWEDHLVAIPSVKPSARHQIVAMIHARKGYERIAWRRMEVRNGQPHIDAMIQRRATREKGPGPTAKNQRKGSRGANLPAGLARKASNLHAVGRTARTRMRTLRRTGKFVALTSPTRELNGQAGSIEIGAVLRLPQHVAIAIDQGEILTVSYCKC